MTTEEDLIFLGWKKRSTHDEPRLTEMVNAYKEIGLEVHIEPFQANKEDNCNECMVKLPTACQTIYTRAKPEV